MTPKDKLLLIVFFAVMFICISVVFYCVAFHSKDSSAEVAAIRDSQQQIIKQQDSIMHHYQLQSNYYEAQMDSLWSITAQLSAKKTLTQIEINNLKQRIEQNNAARINYLNAQSLNQ
jgi:hypothetical protein